MVDYYERTQKSKKRRRAFEKEQARRDRQNMLERQRLQNKGARETTKLSQKAQTERAEKKLGFKKKKWGEERRDEAIQSGADDYYMRNIREGNISPKYATKMSESAQEQLMLQRPDLFPGADVSGSGGSSGGGGGGGIGDLSAPKVQNVWGGSLEWADKQLSEMGGGDLSKYGISAKVDEETGQTKYLDPRGQEMSYQDVRNRLARQRYQNMLTPPGMAFGGGQQGQQLTPAQRTQQIEQGVEEKDQAARQNLSENLITSYIDIEGNPVDASKVKQAEGEGQHYGVLPDGTKVYRKFSMSGVGKQTPYARGGTEPAEKSVASVGFGPGKKDVTGQTDQIRSAIDRVFAGDQARAARRKQLGGEKETTTGKPVAGQMEQKAGSEQKTEKAAAETGTKKEKPEKKAGGRPRGIAGYYNQGENRNVLEVEKDDNQAVREMKQRINTVLNPEKIKEKFGDFVQWWGKTSSRNMPGGQKGGSSGKDMNELSVALRKAGLGENVQKLRQVAQGLIMQYPNASVDEIIRMIKQSASK